ncbi:MAG: SPASM domain-containing protein, partial [Thermoplasmata archaeon]
DEIADLGARIVILDGGEPALREDLVDLVAYSNDSGVKPVLGSNGMSLSEELVTRLLSAGCGGIAISLDGADPRTHDDFRGLEGACERTVEGAKNCAKLGMPFQIAPLVWRDNWTQLRAIVEKAEAIGASAVEVFDYVASGRGRGQSEYELTTEQRKEVIDQIIRWQSSGSITFRVIALPQYWVEVEGTVPEDEVLEKFTRSCCAAGTRYITILPNGDVIPCMVLQTKLGNVREDSLKELWYDSPILEMLRNRELLKGKCGQCKYRVACAGRDARPMRRQGT